MHNVTIGNHEIGDGLPIHIIAEIGGNFTDFETAKKLIDLAVKAGADSVKLQTFTADTIASKKAMYDMPNTGKASQYDLFKKYEIGLELHRAIWDYCESKKLLVFSTPSHRSDIELLEKVGCSVYKIGSDDACNIPFLEEVALTGKPILLSTGMCTMQEVRESVSAILGKGCVDLILLHCVTNYPANPAHSNLRAITAMKREFGLPVGYSDHTIGNVSCLTAAAIGADLLEKHFTFDKKAEGPDHMLSADPQEFAQLVADVRTLEAALGDGVKRPSDGEKITRINNRKSIVAIKDLKPGTILTPEMMAIKRPGTGIAPKYVREIAGRVIRRAVGAEEPITWESL